MASVRGGFIFQAVSSALLLSVIAAPSKVAAQTYARACIETYNSQMKRGEQSLGIEATEAERTVQEVARSIGLSGAINVYPCRFGKVEAIYIGEGTADIKTGEYITYNPDWIREVIGSDRLQLIALLGHELGHFLNRHFTANKGLKTDLKETQADHFAGCAVARTGGNWKPLENLLSRLRRERDDLYPSRLKSLEAAFEGFRACGGGTRPDLVTTLKASASAFCDNLRTLVKLSDGNFVPLRVGEEEEKRWRSSFTFPGFDRCTIDERRRVDYTCFGEPSVDKALITRRRDNLLRDAEKCLGAGWTRQTYFGQGAGLVNNTEQKSFHIFINELPGIMRPDNKAAHYIAMSVADERRKRVDVVARDIIPSNISRTDIPSKYCEQLQKVITEAPTNFRGISGRKSSSSFISKVQINGWQDCRINELDQQNGRTLWYHTCELPTLQDLKSAEAFVATMAADLRMCLGENWTYRIRSTYDKRPVARATSILDGTEVEVRIRDEDDGMWRAKLDVNQAQ